jgi:hypothetical protein
MKRFILSVFTVAAMLLATGASARAYHGHQSYHHGYHGQGYSHYGHGHYYAPRINYYTPPVYTPPCYSPPPCSAPAPVYVQPAPPQQPDTASVNLFSALLAELLRARDSSVGQ